MNVYDEIIYNTRCAMYNDVSWYWGIWYMVLKVNYRTNICQWEKAVNYQMYHGLGLIIIGVISGTTSINVNWAGWLLFLGVVFLVVRYIY